MFEKCPYCPYTDHGYTVRAHIDREHNIHIPIEVSVLQKNIGSKYFFSKIKLTFKDGQTVELDFPPFPATKKIAKIIVQGQVQVSKEERFESK